MIEEARGIAYIDEWLVFQYLKKDSGILKCSYQGWYGNRKNLKFDRYMVRMNGIIENRSVKEILS